MKEYESLVKKKTNAQMRVAKKSTLHLVIVLSTIHQYIMWLYKDLYINVKNFFALRNYTGV